jgi:ATP-dependent Clp protease protease subunit
MRARDVQEQVPAMNMLPFADDEDDEDDRKDGDAAPATAFPSKNAGELFFKSRNVIITGAIDDKLAQRVTMQLIALAEAGDDPINLFISSPGGHVESGDMVHDMIQFIRPVVRTVGSGWVASAGALIFVGAKKENRFCLPNTRFLLHEPRGGIGGTASDMFIQAEQIRMMRERFHRIFAEATGQTPEKIAEDTHRDFWLNTQEAIDYGLLGKVITAADELA